MTSLGRLIRFTPVDLPMLPPTSVQLGAGVRVGDYLALPNRDEKVLALVSLTSDRSIALGTKQGVVKRVSAGAYPNKPEFEVIALKAGDEVVGVVQGDETDELVFVTSDAQLLRFPAASVRPQGCPAGGMAGINLASGAHVIHFRACRGSTPTPPSWSPSPRAATPCPAPTPAARRSANSPSSRRRAGQPAACAPSDS